MCETNSKSKLEILITLEILGKSWFSRILECFGAENGQKTGGGVGFVEVAPLGVLKKC